MPSKRIIEIEPIDEWAKDFNTDKLYLDTVSLFEELFPELYKLLETDDIDTPDEDVQTFFRSLNILIRQWYFENTEAN